MLDGVRNSWTRIVDWGKGLLRCCGGFRGELHATQQANESTLVSVRAEWSENNRATVLLAMAWRPRQSGGRVG